MSRRPGDDEEARGDEERQQILARLREIAKGDRPDQSRDEVATGPRIEVGGRRGRLLICTSEILEATDTRRRIRLRPDAAAGAGDLIVTLSAPAGAWIFAHGDLCLEVDDRRTGAAFAETMAHWLGAPLAAPEALDGETRPPEALAAKYVKLGVSTDANGDPWESFKVFVSDHEEYAEFFLRLNLAGTRATFAEKWSRYREPLLSAIDRAFGLGRPVATRRRVDVPGGAWFTVPADWLIVPQEGHIRVTDAADEALLEVSCQPFPLHPSLPGVAERLRTALSSDGRASAATSLVWQDRGDLELAWAEYPYETTDTKTGSLRTARSRWLVAANGAAQVLATYAYWPSDESWAVPAWIGIISTLRLGASTPPSTDVQVAPDAAVGTTD